MAAREDSTGESSESKDFRSLELQRETTTSSNDPPSFTILYFAAASTYTGKSFERFPAPLPVNSLFTTLETRYPGITAKVLRSCAVTVNLEYVDLDLEEDEEAAAAAWNKARSVPDGSVSKVSDNQVVIQAGDEVGIIPPVSSG